MASSDPAAKVAPPDAEPPTSTRDDLGKLKVRLPLIPGLASWDLEFNAARFSGLLWTRRSVIGRIVVVGSLSLVVGLLGLGGWRLLHREPMPKMQLPEVYALRVVPQDEEGRPVEDTEVKVSVAYERQEVAGGWEIEIPRAKLPANREVTIWVQQPSTSASGRTTIVLDEHVIRTVEVVLKVREAKVRGTVEDAGGRGLAGARVSILGYGDEGVVTKESGSFLLPAHQPTGQRVRVHVEHAAFRPKDTYCYAGGSDCYISLQP